MRKIFVLFVLLVFAGCKQQPPDPTELYARYRSSVVLIQSAFYFKITAANGSSLYCTYQEDYPSFYDTEEEAKEASEPAFGTGFFISQTGEIATNRHVVFPADNAAMQESLMMQLREITDNLEEEISNLESADDEPYNSEEPDASELATQSENRQLRQEQLRELRQKRAKYKSAAQGLASELRIEIKRAFLGVVFNDSRTAGNADYAECIAVTTSGEEAVDLAIIQLKSKKLPDAVTHIFKLGDIPKTPLKLNDPVYMIGFNAGVELATTTNGIKSQFTQGTVTQDPDAAHILYSIPTLPGSSGSPIIDKWGNLVAVNFAKLRDVQSFSFGIPAGLLRNLYNEKEYRSTLPKGPADNRPEFAEAVEAPAAPVAAPPPAGDPAPEPSTELTRMRSYLKGFLAAEDGHDFDQIYAYFAKPMRRYYDLKSPDYNSLQTRYEHLWTLIRNPKNELLSLTQVAPNTYDLSIRFSYYNIKKDESLTKITTVRMVVDGTAGIQEIYGVE